MKSIALIGWFGSTGPSVVCQPGELNSTDPIVDSIKGCGKGGGQFEMPYLSSPVHSGTAKHRFAIII